MSDELQLPSLDLLYHEGPCLVVNKPAGILTQGPPGIDSMVVRVAEYYRLTENKTGNVYVGAPHRLDRPVSGALIFARHVRATRRLADQFAGRIVRKVYEAIVSGIVPDDAGLWEDYVYKIEGEARAEVTTADDRRGKIARLQFRVIERRSDSTRLEIELETGRTHQIRLQSAHRGFPVWGDDLYGSQIAFGPQTVDPRGRHIALHARRIEFRHPMTHLPVAIDAPFPATWG